MYEKFKNLGHEICYCLCWKGKFINAEPDPTVPPSNDDSYWCSLTQTILGPDGKFVEPESCKPGRPCYYQID